MAFHTVNSKQAESEAGSSYITKSGIYDAHLKGIEIGSTTNGATEANYYFDNVNSFNNIVVARDGKPTFGMDIINALGYVAGLGDGAVISDPESTPIKFKNSTKDLMCLPEFVDLDVKVWVQFQYRVWKDEIQERIAIKRIYRTDGASGSEIAGTGTAGDRLAKDETYATTAKYEDNLTAERVQAWKDEQAKARDNKAPAAASTNVGAAAAFPS